MNATPFRTLALRICMLSVAVMCLGCRVAHDLVGPSQRSPSVNQRQEKTSSQPEDIGGHTAAIQPTATIVKVAESDGMLEKHNTEQSSLSAWSANDFETLQVATDPSVNISMPANQVAAPDSTAAQTTALTETSLALASYADALPTPDAVPQAVVPQAVAPQAVAPQAVAPQAAVSDAAKAMSKKSEANLELQIENVRPKRGKLKVAVFTDAENFLNPSFVAQAFELKDDAVTASTSLSIDKPCAIAVFQDLDGNGQLTKNLLGIPVEPCAFSNNAVIKRGPPKFSEAMVQPAEATASPTRTSIRLP